MGSGKELKSLRSELRECGAAEVYTAIASQAMTAHVFDGQLFVDSL